MLRNARRINVAASWQRARAEFAALVAEREALKRELAWTQRSVCELRDALDELRAAVLARHHAEAELAALYRERAITRAQAAQRDPNAALN